MPETLQDPRPLLLAKLNLESTRVEFTSSHIVLLCGGKVKYKERDSDPEPPILSLRHAITHANPEFETFRPEDITDWHTDGIFKNLMSFEEDLAGICSLVAIILESAGAIAELGAFSQQPELSSKIIAIKSRDFESTKYVNSFINLGILRFIKEGSDSAVRNYPWTIDRPASILGETVNDVIADIKDELDRLPKSLVFKKSLNAHVVVAICEIVNLFTALKEVEIIDYLSYFDIHIGREELRRKLFLLEKFFLIKKETYSDSTFYMSGKYKYHKLRLSLKDSGHHDAVRTHTECLAYYKNNQKQRNRFRAIQQEAIGLS